MEFKLFLSGELEIYRFMKKNLKINTNFNVLNNGIGTQVLTDDVNLFYILKFV